MESTSAPAKLPYNAYLEQIEANVEEFVTVLKTSPPETPVPSCPEWSLGELASHAGDFAAFYSHAICDSTGASRPPWPNTWRHAAASPLHGEAPAGYFGDRAQFLLSLLRAAGPVAAVRTWAPDDQSAHFVAGDLPTNSRSIGSTRSSQAASLGRSKRSSRPTRSRRCS